MPRHPSKRSSSDVDKSGRGFFRRAGESFCVGAAALAVTILLVPGIHFHWRAFAFIELAIIWGVVNAVLGTILRFLTLPLRILTLGLIAIVINGVVLVVTAWISPTLSISGFVPAVVGTLVLGVVNWAGHLLINRAH